MESADSISRVTASISRNLDGNFLMVNSKILRLILRQRGINTYISTFNVIKANYKDTVITIIGQM